MLNPATQKPSEMETVVGFITPASASSVQTTAYTDAAQFVRYLGVVQIGALTTTTVTVDAAVVQATSTAGSGSKSLSTGITQITASGTQVTLINIDPRAMDFANGFRYIGMTITPAVGSAVISGVLLGIGPRFGPASTFASGYVTQTIN